MQKKLCTVEKDRYKKVGGVTFFIYICLKNQNKTIIRVCHTEYRKRLILDSRLLYKNYLKNICIIYEFTS